MVKARWAQADPEFNPSTDKGFKVQDRRFWAMDQEELEAEEEQRAELPSYVEQLKSRTIIDTMQITACSTRPITTATSSRTIR